MSLIITLSDEQVNQVIHYGKTKSITSACNLTQSIASMLEAVDNLQSLIKASGYDKTLKKTGGQIMPTNLTRRGVCKDFENSPYSFTYFHNGKVITLNFSSKLHLDNFTKNRQKNWSMIYNHLYKRFKFHIDCVLLSDCNLYQKIENRGFYIKIGNQSYTDVSKIVITD